MNIIIHRGANQIGGCITEISTDCCKVLIDPGSNLAGAEAEEFGQEELDTITEGTDAIFFTHYHGDHVGLHGRVSNAIPQYIGEGAREVMICKYEALLKHDATMEAMLDVAKNMHTYKAKQRIDVGGKGEIFITPYFVSHSAFNAYMFKIECEGKVILHTGDFRKHGFLGKGLIPTLQKYIGQVDILITEGTMLGRNCEKALHESAIEQNVIKALREHKYVFALCSSTDIDRLASFHAACQKTNRDFVVDEYQKNVLDIFSKFCAEKSRLFNFNTRTTFNLVNYKTANVKKRLQDTGFLMPVRASQLKKIENMLRVYGDEEPWLLFSMWDGYAQSGKPYTNEQVLAIRRLFGSRILDGTKDGFHTSGHATVETLQEVCDVVSPRIGIIPIHKEANTTFMAGKDYKVFTQSATTCGIDIIIK